MTSEGGPPSLSSQNDKIMSKSVKKELYTVARRGGGQIQRGQPYPSVLVRAKAKGRAEQASLEAVCFRSVPVEKASP